MTFQNQNKQLLVISMLLTIFLIGCFGADQSTISDEEFFNNLNQLIDNPDSDVPGKDLKTIPRLSDSTRIAYKKRKSGKNLTYMVAYRVENNLNEVSSSYEKKMDENGWLLKVKEENIFTMLFVRKEYGGGLPFVQLMFRPSDDGRMTIVYIMAQNREE